MKTKPFPPVLNTVLLSLAVVLIPVVLVSLYAGRSGLKETSESASDFHGLADGAAVLTVHPHEEEKEEGVSGVTTVFLAGTIDMGAGIDWQAQADSLFRSLPSGNYLLFNPRQEHWDSSRPGEMDYQVNWELEHLEAADYIIMNFLPDSRSPISLLELGLHARSGKLLTICPETFYRYDNVRITCAKYGIPMYASIEEAVRAIASAESMNAAESLER